MQFRFNRQMLAGLLFMLFSLLGVPFALAGVAAPGLSVTITSNSACNGVAFTVTNTSGGTLSTIDISIWDGAKTIFSQTISLANGTSQNFNVSFPTTEPSGTTLVIRAQDSAIYDQVQYNCFGLLTLSGNTSAVPPSRLCDDGRINYNNCDKVAIYPVADEDSYGLEVWIVDDGNTPSFGFFVSAARLDRLPDKPTHNIRIAISKDRRTALYKLTTGEYQVNYGPDAEGKVFVYTFSGLPPTDYPTVTTFMR
jgi:hypothetical protein